jgi:hypothetical protein
MGEPWQRPVAAARASTRLLSETVSMAMSLKPAARR